MRTDLVTPSIVRPIDGAVQDQYLFDS